MTQFLSIGAESETLNILLVSVDKDRFRSAVQRLHALFKIYAATSPEPLPAPGLIITPEIRTQCERYLPIADIAMIFNRLYSAALNYPPILSSTPFYNALSWADVFAVLPAEFQSTPNPAGLLDTLLADSRLLIRFLFSSFLPSRFYGGIGRYPRQQNFIREWLSTRTGGAIHCLDAACGIGEATYGLAILLSESGFSPDKAVIKGCTLEPLEVWAAAHSRFPHDLYREALLKAATSTLKELGFDRCISFHCHDVLNLPLFRGGKDGLFDLILCNGLLGGPILHEKRQLDEVIKNLVKMLAPGGALLAANNFHGGWQQKCPQYELRALFEKHGLNNILSGEGIGGQKR